MRKPALLCENKDADQLRGNREADQLLCFRYIDNTIPQVSSHLLWLCSLVCVGLGRKPRRPVFSQRGSKFYLISALKQSVRTRENRQNDVFLTCIHNLCLAQKEENNHNF